jgi:hypothetical protein
VEEGGGMKLRTTRETIGDIVARMGVVRDAWRGGDEIGWTCPNEEGLFELMRSLNPKFKAITAKYPTDGLRSLENLDRLHEMEKEIREFAIDSIRKVRNEGGHEAAA